MISPSKTAPSRPKRSGGERPRYLAHGLQNSLIAIETHSAQSRYLRFRAGTELDTTTMPSHPA